MKINFISKEMAAIDAKTRTLPTALQVLIEAYKPLQNTDLDFVDNLYYLKDKSLLNMYLKTRKAEGLDFGEFVVDLVNKLVSRKLISKDNVKEYVLFLISHFEDEAAEQLISKYRISLASMMRDGDLPTLIRMFEEESKNLDEDRSIKRYILNHTVLALKLGRLDFLEYLIEKRLSLADEDNERIQVFSQLLDHVSNRKTMQYLYSFFLGYMEDPKLLDSEYESYERELDTREPK